MYSFDKSRIWLSLISILNLNPQFFGGNEAQNETFHDFESARHLPSAKNDYTLKSGMITGTKVKIIRNFISLNYRDQISNIWGIIPGHFLQYFFLKIKGQEFESQESYPFPKFFTTFSLKRGIKTFFKTKSCRNQGFKLLRLEIKGLNETHSLTNSRIFAPFHAAQVLKIPAISLTG